MWSLVLDTAMQCKGVKLPALLTEGNEEEALERMNLLATMDDALYRLYQRYLEQRLGPDWKLWKQEITDWAGAQALSDQYEPEEDVTD
jgi:hypothetical protein